MVEPANACHIGDMNYDILEWFGARLIIVSVIIYLFGYCFEKGN